MAVILVRPKGDDVQEYRCNSCYYSWVDKEQYFRDVTYRDMMIKNLETHLSKEAGDDSWIIEKQGQTIVKLTNEHNVAEGHLESSRKIMKMKDDNYDSMRKAKDEEIDRLTRRVKALEVENSVVVTYDSHQKEIEELKSHLTINEKLLLSAREEIKELRKERDQAIDDANFASKLLHERISTGMVKEFSKPDMGTLVHCPRCGLHWFDAPVTKRVTCWGCGNNVWTKKGVQGH
jgi:hypothetical protein